jgi:putative tricarboxylic transport membrane protein
MSLFPGERWDFDSRGGIELETLQNVYYGFTVILTPINMLYCFVGVVMGTLIGVLPGIGPTTTLALLLPVTFKMTPVEAMILLAGIYYGAMYGGSTTSILVNIPGEAASVVTCLDGYQMAMKGRAGPALGIAAFGSFIAGTLSVVGLMLLAPTMASLSLRIGPPEFFSLLCMGLILVIYLSSTSFNRSVMMAVFGIILGSVGQDPEFGSLRLTFDIKELMSGIDLVPVAMGLFGISEVLLNIEKSSGKKFILETKMKELLPSKQDWKDSYKPILRGSVIGYFLGILPGGGAFLSSFTSYAVEKKLSKHPELFGTGIIEGVAGPESANNAGAGGSFVPLFTLGIPSNVVTALLLGALMIQGVTPGPLLIPRNPEIFWGVVASMYIGNVMLLVLNLPLIGLWVQVLKVPYKILFPLILLVCMIGSFSINNNTFDMIVMLIFGVLGYLLKKYGYASAPLILAFVLGPMFETSLRQSLVLSDGSFMIFLKRPIAAIGIIFVFFMVVSSAIPAFRRKKSIIEETTD